jgi:hypothetical protein
MKKSILSLLVAGMLWGCNNNFDPVLTGTLAPANFPKTEGDFALYSLQAYKPFGSKWGYGDVAYQNMFFSPEFGHLFMFDLPTDQFTVFTEWGGQFEFFSKADFTFLRNQGKESHFEKIRFVTRMTTILNDIDQSEISDAAKTRFKAEVRMARGWAMYYLLHLYGPVPVILDPAQLQTEAESDLTRPSRANFVAAIESDLKFAADNLVKTPAEYGRFNKGLALGVLMRLYLNEKDFAKAEPVGRQIQEMGYSLVTDYASLFREATEKNSETIWAVSADPTATGNNLQGNFNAWAFYCLPSDFKGTSLDGGWATRGVFTATWEFYDSFETTDKRRQMLIPSYTSKTGVARNRSNMEGAVVRKYPDESGTTNVQGNDIPLLRYADVMLMLAEAINENKSGPTPEAIALVNEVRAKHGGLAPLPAAAVASKAAFNDAILAERGHDLYFEGVRKMDLIRHGKWNAALTGVGKVPGPMLFPVPQYAINVSEGKLQQTEGF